MSGPRNQHGVNDAADCYRTIKGERFIAWMSFPSAARIRAYRQAGIPCRRFGEELFVHHASQMAAAGIDAEIDEDRP